MNILQLRRNAKVVQLNLQDKVYQTFLANGNSYVDYIKIQLYEGEDRFGNPIRPNYLEDVGPGKFLKTKEQAIAYALYKRRISPANSRNLFTPNLFINGFFYDSMTIKINPGVAGLGSIIIQSSAGFSADIFRKYGIPPFQLQNDNRKSFVELRLRKPINKYIAETLNR